MHSSELECAIRSNHCFRPYFRGIFARDTLPDDVKEYPSVYIVNTDPSDRPGTHWTAIVIKSRGYGLFFDSFGNHPGYYGEELARFMDSTVYHYDHFRTKIQSNDSHLCGYFVLAFLFSNMCLFLSLKSFRELFSINLSVNDCIVYDFVNVYYDIC